jgi:hypothetical protein
MAVITKLYVDPSDISGVVAGRDSVTNSITAYAGGGQTNATALTSAINRVTTVASGNDSVKLPAATVGARVEVINATATNSLNVYPVSGEYMNATQNGAFAVAAVKAVSFICAVTGTWNTLYSA